ncbi:hypothetical protein M3Y99_00526400 [Aphelenchoides fujianensis]|nr:hypothetical protein M3Y99_00526400 [Aphelenchoides fujianensis]
MVAVDEKKKPRIRAALRDGLNRFFLVEKMETDETKGTAQILRLAAISRAQLTSVRRLAAGIKFKQTNRNWRLLMAGGLGTPKISFPLVQTEMIGIVKLLDVPVHLKFGEYCEPNEDADWEELQQIEQWVHGLGVYNENNSPEFSSFISNVAPHLKVLYSTWSVLEKLPPLDLKWIRLHDMVYDVGELKSHKIRRLDVPAYELEDYSDLESDQVMSASIKSLGLIMDNVDWADVSYDSIEAFRRRFSELEEIHVICKRATSFEDPSAYLTALWAKCLEIRDRLHVAGLKRLFLTVKHDSTFCGMATDWFEKLKQVEPFEKATFTIDRFNEHVRMFLKHNEPRGPKPTFVCIKGNFWWSVQEEEETHEDLSDDQMDDEDEGDYEAMEKDGQFDDSTEDAMDESADEDGMDDADGN